MEVIFGNIIFEEYESDFRTMTVTGNQGGVIDVWQPIVGSYEIQKEFFRIDFGYYNVEQIEYIASELNLDYVTPSLYERHITTIHTYMNMFRKGESQYYWT